MSADDILRRTKLLENEIRVLQSETTRLTSENKGLKERINENKEKIKLNNQLPYLVGNIVEVLDIDPEEEEEEDGAAMDVDSQRKGKCVVLKTSTRQTIFLPVVGLVDPLQLRPGDLVGVNKDSYLVLDKLPAEYDSRVKVRGRGIVLCFGLFDTCLYLLLTSCGRFVQYKGVLCPRSLTKPLPPHPLPPPLRRRWRWTRSRPRTGATWAAWTSRSRSWWRRSSCRSRTRSASNPWGSSRRKACSATGRRGPARR
jgi:hypothetical protein